MGSRKSVRFRRRPCRIGAAGAMSYYCFDMLEARVLLASTIYVDASAPGPTYDGTTWATAYADLQQGLAAAASGDEIHVADGTYEPTATADRTISFVLKDGISLLGGYGGFGALDPDARDVSANLATLSGDIGVRDKTDNSYHVVLADGTGDGATLDGFTITAGNADGESAAATEGGGMYISSSSPKVQNCTFDLNSAAYGGGLYAHASSASLVDCGIWSNTADGGGGGGVYAEDSPIVLTRCTLAQNGKESGPYSVHQSGPGGAMYVLSSSATITDCTFRGNETIGEGGGIIVVNSAPVITGCVFERNYAIDGGGAISSDSAITVKECRFEGNQVYRYGGAVLGGGVFIGCTFTQNSAFLGGAVFNGKSLINCTFVDNFAFGTPSDGPVVGYGGAVEVYSGSTAIVNCVFKGNSASNGGGALAADAQSSPILTNCTFIGNTAAKNGGAVVALNQSSPRFQSCTFTDNGAGGYGGAIANTNSSPTLVNCIIWGNIGKDTSNSIYNADSSSVPKISYSDIEGGYVGTGNINAGPRFMRYPGHGPDHIVGSADDDPGDLHLRLGSPCIDAGANRGLPRDIRTDFGGAPRIVDVPGVHDPGAIVDMGAYEAPANVTAGRGQLLTIDGSNSADVISISRNTRVYTITRSGFSQTIQAYSLREVSSLAVYGFDRSDRIALGAGVPGSYISGGRDNDVLTGAEGNDTIEGGGGADRIYGGAGNDKLNGSPSVYYLDGDDYIDGGPGNDLIHDYLGDDTLVGGEGNDTIYGGWWNDQIYGGDGNDILYGEDGSDVLYGADGLKDTIYGGSGSDRAHRDLIDELHDVEASDTLRG
jgi:predicted outer membrane repeat protein